MAAESTLIYPKARPLAAPASLRKSSASLRPEGQLSVGPSVLNTLECMLITSWVLDIICCKHLCLMTAQAYCCDVTVLDHCESENVLARTN